MVLRPCPSLVLFSFLIPCYKSQTCWWTIVLFVFCILYGISLLVIIEISEGFTRCQLLCWNFLSKFNIYPHILYTIGQTSCISVVNSFILSIKLFQTQQSVISILKSASQGILWGCSEKRKITKLCGILLWIHVFPRENYRDEML